MTLGYKPGSQHRLPVQITPQTAQREDTMTKQSTNLAPIATNRLLSLLKYWHLVTGASHINNIQSINQSEKD